MQGDGTSTGTEVKMTPLKIQSNEKGITSKGRKISGWGETE